MPTITESLLELLHMSASGSITRDDAWLRARALIRGDGPAPPAVDHSQDDDKKRASEYAHPGSRNGFHISCDTCAMALKVIQGERAQQKPSLYDENKETLPSVMRSAMVDAFEVAINYLKTEISECEKWVVDRDSCDTVKENYRGGAYSLKQARDYLLQKATELRNINETFKYSKSLKTPNYAQPVPSQSDEEAAEKFAEIRADLALTLERQDASWRTEFKETFLAGCQHKEASLRGEIDKIREDFHLLSVESIRDEQSLAALKSAHTEEIADITQRIIDAQKERDLNSESLRLTQKELSSLGDSTLSRKSAPR